MESNCLNCNEIITGNFCSNCGQKKYRRIDKKYIWEEVQYSILHTNKGFLYSVKKIIKNPGKTAREFIDGNRVKHYKPILLAFVLSGISAFISFKVLGLYDILVQHYSSSVANANSKFMNEFLSFLSSYNSILMLLALPFLALITKFVFRKWGQNYYEHIVMNAYILSCYTLVSIIITFPLMYFLKQDFNAVMLVSGFSFLMLPFILVWFYKGFYPGKTLKSIIWKVLGTLGLVTIGYIGLVTLGMIVGLFFNNNIVNNQP
jgi:hypothetical protein